MPDSLLGHCDSDAKVLLHGGPAHGLHVETRSASVLVDGREHARPGEVARYRRTRSKDAAGCVVYSFKGWDRIVAQIEVPEAASDA